MEMNKDEAAKCQSLGDRYYRAQQYEKSIKFYAKSLRLYPLDGVKQRLDSARVMATAQKRRSTSSAPAPAPAPAPSPSASSSSSGPRRRRATAGGRAAPASSGSASRRASAPATNGNADASSGGDWTPKQKEIADRINGCDDFYQILGVPRDADEAAIKKAYKKLALRLHPDKNSYPGATDAFKKVSQAVATLTDADKRSNYNQFGSESRPASQYTRRYHEQELSPEDLFDMMFGGGMGGRRFYTNVTMFNFGDSEKAVFSLNSSKEFRIRRETTHPAVVQSLVYFVRSDFEQKYGRDLYKVESAVERYTYDSLKRECHQQKQKKNRLQYWARRASGRESQKLMKQAEQVSLASCDTMSNLFGGRYFM